MHMSSPDAEELGQSNYCKQQPPNHNGVSQFLTHVTLHNRLASDLFSLFLASPGFTHLQVHSTLSLLPADGEVE